MSGSKTRIGLIVRSDGCAGMGDWDAVDDDAVGWVEPGTDDAKPSRRSPIWTCFGVTTSLRPTVSTMWSDWSGSTGGIRHEQRWVPAGRLDAHTSEAAGRQETVGIGNGGAGMDRAARAIKRVVDEVERAVMGKSGVIGERDLHLVGEHAALLLTLTQERHVVGLAHVEIQVDRVDRDDRGEQGGRAGARPAAGDQVADGDLVSADAAGEGRGDAGMIEVELGVADRRQGVIDGRLGGVLLGRLWSAFSTLPAPVRFSVLARKSSRLARSRRAWALSTWATASLSLIWYGSGSIRNSRSPLWTMSPSLKPIWVNVPPTWARSSTCWTAENWPVTSIRPSTWREAVC